MLYNKLFTAGRKLCMKQAKIKQFTPELKKQFMKRMQDPNNSVKHSEYACKRQGWLGNTQPG